MKFGENVLSIFSIQKLKLQYDIPAYSAYFSFISKFASSQKSIEMTAFHAKKSVRDVFP